MNDNYHSDVLSAIKGNPKAFFSFMTAIMLSCFGLLIATLYETSMLAIGFGWLLVLTGIVFSWNPLQRVITVAKKR